MIWRKYWRLTRNKQKGGEVHHATRLSLIYLNRFPFQACFKHCLTRLLCFTSCDYCIRSYFASERAFYSAVLFSRPYVVCISTLQVRLCRIFLLGRNCFHHVCGTCFRKWLAYLKRLSNQNLPQHPHLCAGLWITVYTRSLGSVGNIVLNRWKQS